MILGKSIYQITLSLVAIVFILSSAFKYLKKEETQTLFKFFVSIVVWGLIFAFSLFPEMAHVISKKLGLGENLNTLIFTGFIAVFIIVFKLLSIIERLERNISEIVRKGALSKIESRNNYEADKKNSRIPKG